MLTVKKQKIDIHIRLLDKFNNYRDHSTPRISKKAGYGSVFRGPLSVNTPLDTCNWDGLMFTKSSMLPKLFWEH